MAIRMYQESNGLFGYSMRWSSVAKRGLISDCLASSQAVLGGGGRHRLKVRQLLVMLSIAERRGNGRGVFGCLLLAKVLHSWWHKEDNHSLLWHSLWMFSRENSWEYGRDRKPNCLWILWQRDSVWALMTFVSLKRESVAWSYRLRR